MSRIYYTITEGQAKRFRDHCRRLSNEMSEYPGFSYRRIIHAVNFLLDTGISLDEFKDALKMVVLMHRKGICFRRVCGKIDKVKSIVKR